MGNGSDRHDMAVAPGTGRTGAPSRGGIELDGLRAGQHVVRLVGILSSDVPERQSYPTTGGLGGQAVRHGGASSVWAGKRARRRGRTACHRSGRV